MRGVPGQTGQFKESKAHVVSRAEVSEVRLRGSQNPLESEHFTAFTHPG